MSQDRNTNEYLIKAGMYDLLANFYKYSNPDRHIAYYKEHLKYIHLAVQSSRTSMMPSQSSTGPAGQGKVRFVNASADAENVDIYIDSLKIFKDFSYKDASGYLSLPSGKHQIDIYPAGNATTTILSRKVVVEPGKLYTLIFAGTKTNVKWLALEDDPRLPQGETKIRFAHLSPDAPALDIAVKKRDVIFSNVAYRGYTDYLGLSPMVIDLEARVQGSNNIVLPMPQVQLKPNRTYTILILGSAAEEPGMEAMILKG